MDGMTKMTMLVVIVLACGLLVPGSSLGAPPQSLGCVDGAKKYCVVPAAAAGWQLNLADWSKRNGVMLAGLVLQHDVGTLPLGIGAYIGIGAGDDKNTSYQGCLGISITSWGLLCGGVQRTTFPSGGAAWQGMITLAGQLTWGGTPSYLRAVSPAATGP